MRERLAPLFAECLRHLVTEVAAKFSREQMQQAIGSLEQAGGHLPEWQARTARELKASRAVFGSFRVDGGQIIISATVLDMDHLYRPHVAGFHVNLDFGKGGAVNASGLQI